MPTATTATHSVLCRLDIINCAAHKQLPDMRQGQVRLPNGNMGTGSKKPSYAGDSIERTVNWMYS